MSTKETDVGEHQDLSQQQHEEEEEAKLTVVDENATSIPVDVSPSPSSSFPKTAEEKANIISYLLFWWLSDMFSTGYKRQLELKDLTYLRHRDSALSIHTMFSAAWTAQPIDDRSVFKAIMSAFGGIYYFALVLLLIYTLLGFAGPVLLGRFIDAAQRGDTDEQYIIAAILFGVYMVNTLVIQQHYHHSINTGMKARGALITSLYAKALRRSTDGSDKEQSSGKTLNLITTDCQVMVMAFQFAPMILSGPLQICVAVYLLYEQIQWSVFVGFGVQMCIMVPLQVFIGKRTQALQKALLKTRDSRLGIVNEVFGAIKVVKMYAWESSFTDKLTDIRKGELALLFKYALIYSFNIVFFYFSATMVNLAAFASYTAAGYDLDAKKIFVSIALFDILRIPLALLPMFVGMAINANVSLKRVREYLLSPEVDSEQIEFVKGTQSDAETDVSAPGMSIEVRDATFYWDFKQTEVALNKINVAFKSGSLTMIIGQTGSGKTALLRAILGGLTKSDGRLMYYASPLQSEQRISVGYSSQVAWIQNATVKDNILFGETYDEAFYKKVIRACELVDDFKMFPDGDTTEIGEKGINLSGGQKQRISLARAVYSRADVYMFDDPLSAVDPAVASHIFKHCFSKLLKENGKTVILTTHAMGFLQYASNIVVMANNQIQIQGKLKELQEADIDLATISKRKKKRDGLLGRQHTGEFMDGDDDIDNEDYDGTDIEASMTMMPSMHSLRTMTSFKHNAASQKKGALVSKEAREKGGVGFDIYSIYIRALGGWCLMCVLVAINAIRVGADSYSVFWLAEWAGEAGNDGAKSNWYYLGVYTAIVAGSILFFLASSLTLLRGRIRASQMMHDKLLDSMMHAKMEFFDETPFGRIINRFAKDMNDIDKQLPMTFGQVLRLVISVAATLIKVAVVTPLFVVAALPLMALYWWGQRYCVVALRELKRLSSNMASPIYSHFGESLQGVDVIRALGKQQQFETTNQRLVDNDMKCIYPSNSANRWLAVRLEFIGNCLVGGAAFSCVLTQPKPELVGIAITSMMSITGLLNYVILQKTQLEQDIVAVERVNQYFAINPEAPFIVETNRPTKEWPTNGEIYFSNIWMRYRENLDFILKGISFEVAGGEKVGVIGRTGAGKSSLFLTLLRLVEYEREDKDSFIEIDGVSIGELGLQDLRSKISVIPQDPIMFVGTIRYNLDPFGLRSDDVLRDSLKSVYLLDAVKKMAIEGKRREEKAEAEKKATEEKAADTKETDDADTEKKTQAGEEAETEELVVIDLNDAQYNDVDPLDVEVEENGRNFSLGQRQLLCMARAICRKSQILLLDEATSSVDPTTDKLIQATIRKEFAQQTVLTIAHRIDTILDYDKILILEAGNVLEYASPKTLLEDEESKFSEIVKESFGVDVKQLFEENPDIAAAVAGKSADEDQCEE